MNTEQMAFYHQENDDLGINHNLVTKTAIKLAEYDGYDISWVLDVYGIPKSYVWKYIKRAEELLIATGLAEQSSVEQSLQPLQQKPSGNCASNCYDVSSVDVSSVPLVDELALFSDELTQEFSCLVENSHMQAFISDMFAYYYLLEQIALRLMKYNPDMEVKQAKLFAQTYLLSSASEETKERISQLARLN